MPGFIFLCHSCMQFAVCHHSFLDLGKIILSVFSFTSNQLCALAALFKWGPRLISQKLNACFFHRLASGKNYCHRCRPSPKKPETQGQVCESVIIAHLEDTQQCCLHTYLLIGLLETVYRVNRIDGIDLLCFSNVFGNQKWSFASSQGARGVVHLQASNLWENMQNYPTQRAAFPDHRGL